MQELGLLGGVTELVDSLFGVARFSRSEKRGGSVSVSGIEVGVKFFFGKDSINKDDNGVVGKEWKGWRKSWRKGRKRFGGGSQRVCRAIEDMSWKGQRAERRRRREYEGDEEEL